MTTHPGFFETGDEGMIDQHGYVHILSRNDDVINVAGHRLDTGRLEEAISNHPKIVESAVIGLNDAIKGQVPVAIVVLHKQFLNSDP
jgi:propionyl-CoA synthetase